MRFELKFAFATMMLIVGQLGLAGSHLGAEEPGPVEQELKNVSGKIYVHAAYTRMDEAGNRSNFNGISAIDPNSGDVTEIVGMGNSVRTSPDGKKFAITTSPAASERQKSCGAIHIIAGSTFETQTLVEDAMLPSWFGKGKLIFNTGAAKPGEGWHGKASIIDLTSKEIHELPVPKSDAVTDISAAGTTLLTMSNRQPPFGSNYQIYSMSFDGTDQRQLTRPPGMSSYGRFRPDGKEFVYQHREGPIDSLWVSDMDCHDQRELLKSQEGNGSIDGACWSPDGKHLAVVRFNWIPSRGGLRRRGPISNHRLEIIAPSGQVLKAVQLQGVSEVQWLGKPDWNALSN